MDCVLRNLSLQDIANALSETERPKTPEEMIEWVVATMRDVKVALEKADFNGFFYDASFQLHHKKPGVSPMQRDPKKCRWRKPTSSAAPPLCNFCGGIHTMNTCRQKSFPDANADASLKWINSVVGKAWKERHDCNWRPGGPKVTLENYVKQGEQA
jgi:hypothetical protein